MAARFLGGAAVQNFSKAGHGMGLLTQCTEFQWLTGVFVAGAFGLMLGMFVMLWRSETRLFRTLAQLARQSSTPAEAMGSSGLAENEVGS